MQAPAQQSAIDPRLLDEVAAWLARLEAPDCTDLDRAGFERWRQTDDAHEAAAAAGQRLSVTIAHLLAAHPEVGAFSEQESDFDESSSEPMQDVVAHVSRRRSWWIPAAMAAGVVAIAISALLLRSTHVAPTLQPTIFQAAEHEPSDVSLSDGTRIHLDAGGSIAVIMNNHERLVELRAGRAIFDVAHDTTKPFSVTAGRGRVTAVGTRFQVERSADDVRVTLAQGVVLVTNGARDGGFSHSEYLQPGEELAFGLDSSSWNKRVVDIDTALAWSRGRLIFHGSPLAEVVETLSKYSDHPIILSSSTLAPLEVNGTFAIGDTAGAIAALAVIIPVNVAVDSSGNTVLSPVTKHARSSASPASR